MANDANIKTRSARGKLPASGKAFFTEIGDGISLGYRSFGGTKPGAWVARQYDDATKRYAQRQLGAVADDHDASNGSTVLAYQEAVELARTNAGAVVADAAGLTISAAIREWRDAKLADPSTPDEQRGNIRSMAARLMAAFDGVGLMNLKRARLLKWREARLAEVKPATFDREAAVVQAALTAAVRNHGLSIDASAWAGLKLGKAKSSDEGRRLVTLTVDQIEAILAHAGDGAPILRFMAETGCRNIEALRLRVGAVAYNGTTVAATLASGKSRPRTIILPPKAAQVVRDAIAGANDPDRRVFLRADGLPFHNDRTWLGDRWNAAVKAAGV